MVRSTVFAAGPRHGGMFPDFLWLEVQLPPLEDQASFHLAGAASRDGETAPGNGRFRASEIWSPGEREKLFGFRVLGFRA